uniref:Uncharacterized protein n=1 Tax=Anguilla anguilla TaxID=7936 RepID=A0A0E9UK34_ANGAN
MHKRKTNLKIQCFPNPTFWPK